MKVEEIRTVGVVGAGSMGMGIIQVAAQSGFEVKAVDVDDATCARAAKAIAKILVDPVAKFLIALMLVGEPFRGLHEFLPDQLEPLEPY